MSTVCYDKMEETTEGVELSRTKAVYYGSMAGNVPSEHRWNAEELETRQVCGLRNLGNTCFLNTALQGLFHTYILFDVLEKSLTETTAVEPHRLVRKPSEIKVIPDPAVQHLTSTLHQLFHEMRTHSSSSSRELTLREIIGILSEKDSRYGSRSQEDSAEALRYLLDIIREEENRRMGTAIEKALLDMPGERMSELRLKALSRIILEDKKRETLVDKIFGGSLEMRSHCEQCGDEQEDESSFTHLDLALCDFPSEGSRGAQDQGRDNGVDVTRSSGLPSSSGAAIDIKHSNTKQPFKSIYPRLDDVSKPITEQPRESKSGKTMPARHARTPSAKKCGSSSTIEDCLEQFIRPEVIRGENSLCQACDLKARRMGATPDGRPRTYGTEKRELISKLPETLIINLKRFRSDHGQMKKRLDPVVITSHLNMAKYCTEQVKKDSKDEGKSMQFAPFAIISHEGSTLSSGHYVAYVKLRKSPTVECKNDMADTVNPSGDREGDEGHHKSSEDSGCCCQGPCCCCSKCCTKRCNQFGWNDAVTCSWESYTCFCGMSRDLCLVLSRVCRCCCGWRCFSYCANWCGMKRDLYKPLHNGACPALMEESTPPDGWYMVSDNNVSPSSEEKAFRACANYIFYERCVV